MPSSFCIGLPMTLGQWIPFGHLHSAWTAFLEGMSPDDALWSFSANWTTWGRKEIREGYVIVRGDIVGAHFQTVWKDEEEVETETKQADDLAWRKKLADCASWRRSDTFGEATWNTKKGSE